MGIGDRLNRLLPDLAAVLARFPLPVLISGLLCLYLNLEAGWDFGSPDEEIIFGGAAGFMASGAAHLFAEGRQLARALNLGLALAAGLAAAALANFATVFATSQILLFAALLLVLMVAAYLKPGAKQVALWLFNLRLGLAALLAVIVTVAVAGGLSAIVEALNFLFDADLPNNLHEHIWSTAASFIAPVYGLALMPKDLDEEVKLADGPDSLLERGVSVLVNYVLVPLIAIYALILHAYAVKIALQWRLPGGEIGTMVSIFALGGTGAWLIAWPWRETGTRLLRLFMASWFRITVVPAILLAIAIWRRVADYGVTPERYGLVLIAFWLSLIAAYLGWRRSRADLRAILGGLAILLLVGSFGPWGAKGVTITSQFARLTGLLEEKGMLKDGKLALPPPKLDDTSRTSGFSMLHALQEAGGLDRLRPWFEGQTGDPFKTGEADWGLSAKIGETLGFNLGTAAADAVSFTALTPGDIRAGAGNPRIIGPLRLMSYAPSPAGQPDFTAATERADIVIKAGGRRWLYPVRSLLEKAKAAYTASPGSPKAFAVEVGPEITLLIDSAYGTLGDEPQLNSAVFWVVLRE